MRTVLIPSGAYVTDAMQAEFGRIPPVFLSVAHQILLRHQAEELRAAGHADLWILTLPEDYPLSDRRRREVEDLGFEIVLTPRDLSLGAAMSYALNAGTWHHDELRVLLGDTLLTDLTLDVNDIFATGTAPFAGEWAHFDATGDGEFRMAFYEEGVRDVVSGFFSFSSTREWLRALTLARYDFAAALTMYHDRRPLVPSNRGHWYDFGRIQTFYRSRRTHTTERHFNELEISDHVVRKKSRDRRKVLAEANWFENLPRPLRLFTPPLLDTFETEDSAGYALEYLYMLPLNECYTVFDLPLERWRTVIGSCRTFLESCQEYTAEPDPRLEALYGEKTRTRLADFCDSARIDIDHPWIVNGRDMGSLDQAAKKAMSLVPPVQKSCVMHGDFCFSNILFDIRAGLIKVIDPRGGVDLQDPSIYGDPRYDLAKLHHSFEGHYDLILAGQARLEMGAPYHAKFEIDVERSQTAVSSLFAEQMLTGDAEEVRAIRAISTMLFLSMLPLHADKPDRQMMLAMNALRLADTL